MSVVCKLLGHIWRPVAFPNDVAARCIRCGVAQEPADRWAS